MQFFCIWKYSFANSPFPFEERENSKFLTIQEFEHNFEISGVYFSDSSPFKLHKKVNTFEKLKFENMKNVFRAWNINEIDQYFLTINIYE